MEEMVDRGFIEGLWEMLEPVVLSRGLELVELEFQREPRGWVLRLYIEREGGVTLDDCTAVSREVGDLLDVKDPIDHPYHLEVSSPGFDRPIRKRADFERFTGERIRVTLSGTREQRRVVKGTLLGLEGEKLRLEGEGGVVEIALSDVFKARLIYRWTDGIGQGVK